MPLIAITQIEVTLALGQAGDSTKGLPSMPPKTLSVAPGTLFIAADKDQEYQLVAMGAARLAEARETTGRDDVLDFTDVASARAAQKAEFEHTESILAKAAYLTAFGEAASPQMRPADMRERIAEKAEAEAEAKKAEAKKAEAEAKKAEADARKTNRDQQADKLV